MFLARVVGNVVATIKHRELEGRKLQLVQPEGPDGQPRGRALIAVDTVDAGTGDRVLVLDEGNGAAQVVKRPRGPIRTVIVGVIDEVDEHSSAGPARG
jgi:microcompartment protein CcmK/EutM